MIPVAGTIIISSSLTPKVTLSSSQALSTNSTAFLWNCWSHFFTQGTNHRGYSGICVTLPLMFFISASQKLLTWSMGMEIQIRQIQNSIRITLDQLTDIIEYSDQSDITKTWKLYSRKRAVRRSLLAQRSPSWLQHQTDPQWCSKRGSKGHQQTRHQSHRTDRT